MRRDEDEHIDPGVGGIAGLEKPAEQRDVAEQRDLEFTLGGILADNSADHDRVTVTDDDRCIGSPLEGSRPELIVFTAPGLILLTSVAISRRSVSAWLIWGVMVSLCGHIPVFDIGYSPAGQWSCSAR